MLGYRLVWSCTFFKPCHLIYSFKETDMFVRMRHKAILTAYLKVLKFLSIKFNGIHNLNPIYLPIHFSSTVSVTHLAIRIPSDLKQWGRVMLEKSTPLFKDQNVCCIQAWTQIFHSKIFSSLLYFIFQKEYIASLCKLLTICLYLSFGTYYFCKLKNVSHHLPL